MDEAEERFAGQHMVGGSSVSAHQRRYDRWKEEQKQPQAAPMPGGLLPPPPTTAPTRVKGKAPKTTQKQIKHEWAYIVFWYEELRRHNPGGFGPQAISFPAILAYRDLFGIDMEPWEIDTLLKVDMRWFAALPKTGDKGEA